MCGIAGFYILNDRKMQHVNAEKLLDGLLRGIAGRGGDATGYAAFGKSGELLDHVTAACDVPEFTKNRRRLPQGTRYVLAHTRFATQGSHAFPYNNHPVRSGDTLVTHNGHIRNDFELWNEVGYDRRMADVDSEIIPAMIEKHGWSQCATALESLEGAFAIAAARCNDPVVKLAKGVASPLNYLATNHIIVWASTDKPILSAWASALGTPPKGSKIHSAKTGDFITITPDGLKVTVFNPQIWTSALYTVNTIGKNPTPAKSAGESARVFAFSKGWDPDADYELDSRLIEDEINMRRTIMDQIMATEKWWDDDDALDEYNDLASEVRRFKNDLIELTYGRYSWDDDDDDDDDDDEIADSDSNVYIKCASCTETTPLSDMAGGDELYCKDCWNFWQAELAAAPKRLMKGDDA